MLMYSKAENRGIYENDNSGEVENYWETCRQHIASNEKYKFIVAENTRLLSEAREIMGEAYRTFGKLNLLFFSLPDISSLVFVLECVVRLFVVLVFYECLEAVLVYAFLE